MIPNLTWLICFNWVGEKNAPTRLVPYINLFDGFKSRIYIYIDMLLEDWFGRWRVSGRNSTMNGIFHYINRFVLNDWNKGTSNLFQWRFLGGFFCSQNHVDIFKTFESDFKKCNPKSQRVCFLQHVWNQNDWNILLTKCFARQIDLNRNERSYVKLWK